MNKEDNKYDEFGFFNPFSVKDEEKKEPCTDAISRQAVLNLAKFDGRDGLGSIIHAFDVEQLPPVIPAEKHEPCADAISRQAAKKALEDRFIELQKRHSENRYETNFCLNTILELPPVNPAEKVGHWIDHQEDRWIYAECSECETVHDSRTNYCPNCGAKMGGEQNV